MKRSAIERLLPEIFRRTLRSEAPLGAVLDLMEGLHAPSERALSRLGGILDARASDEDFVPYLACWLDLDRLFDQAPEDGEVASARRHSISTGTGRLRELISSAPYLSQWRGTARGLIRFLEVASGVGGFTIDEAVPDAQGVPRPFHIRVKAPASVALHRNLIERIIRLEKPAYVSYELSFEERTREGP